MVLQILSKQLIMLIGITSQNSKFYRFLIDSLCKTKRQAFNPKLKFYDFCDFI